MFSTAREHGKQTDERRTVQVVIHLPTAHVSVEQAECRVA